MSVIKNCSDYAHKSSSMKSVLTQYGLKEQRSQKPPSKEKKPRVVWTPEEKASRRTPTRKKKAFFEETILIEDTQDIVERKKEKDKRVLQMLSDIQRLRYYYYLEYKERLVDKVEKQREEAHRLKEREEKLRQRREMRALQEAHKLKRRHQRVPLKHDEEFLNNLPQTDFYRIIREEQRLIKEGKLRTMTAKETFWNEQLTGNPHLENMRSEHLETSSLTDTEGGDQPTNLPRQLQPLAGAPNPDLDRISEGDERSRPSTKKTVRGKSFTKKLEAMFPKMELPPLHIFDMDLSQKVDEEEERRLKAIEERLRQRENRKAMYNRMFNLALTHNAISKRIIEDRMDETAQMMFQREFTTLGDLVAEPSQHSIQKLMGGEDEQDEEENGQECTEDENPIQEETHEEEDKEEEEEETTSVAATVDLPKTPELKVIPLALRELETSLPTKTSVKLSCMWTNYMKEPRKLQPIGKDEDESVALPT